MYAYIILPYTKTKQVVRDQKKEGFSIGSLMTSAKNLNFTGKDGVFSQISKGAGALEEVNSKFSVVAMTQLLKDGKISNSDALNYFCTGFANQLGLTSVSMGYQTVNACKEALSSGNINATQFLSNIGKYTDFLAKQDEANALNKEQIIIIDSVLSENVGERQIETAERRVENGQTLTEFLHNMPETFNLSCAFFEGENYTWSDFKFYMDYLIDKKIEVQLQLGDETYSHLVLTQFTPSRDTSTSSRNYQLSFKRISVGSVETTTIQNESLKLKERESVATTKNPTDSARQEKTEKVSYQSELDKLVEANLEMSKLEEDVKKYEEEEGI